MPRVLLSDHEFPDVDLERQLFASAGVEMVAAQCKTGSEVIDKAVRPCGAYSVRMKSAYFL